MIIDESIELSHYDQEGLLFPLLYLPFLSPLVSTHVVLSGVMVIVLAIGPKVCGFKPSQERRIFKGNKNLMHDILWRGSKSVGPMS
jgi:hypothetical protein